MQTIELIVERSNDALWGRLKFEDNLIVDEAENIGELKQQMKQLLKDFHDLDDVDFNVCYDLTALFQEFSFLNVSDVAKQANINPGLFRQYVAGVKYPSSDRALHIENTLHELGKKLTEVSLVANGKA